VLKLHFEVFILINEGLSKNVFVFFSGINLWSNNVPIQDGTANFIARENKSKEFDFNLSNYVIT
jgi:hypothetical protein